MYLWTPGSSAHPMHSPPVLLPSAVPRFTQVPHRAIDRPDVTPFTRPGERGCCVAEQWTGVGKSCGQPPPACGPPVDNVDQGLWTTAVSTDCGDRSATNPQPADLPGTPCALACCGPSWDNFAVPRLWREDLPQICGEGPAAAGYSNTPHPAERCEQGAGRAGGVPDARRVTAVAPVGRPPLRPAGGRVFTCRAVPCRRLLGGARAAGAGLPAAPRSCPRPPPERRRRPGTRSPGALDGVRVSRS